MKKLLFAAAFSAAALAAAPALAQNYVGASGTHVEVDFDGLEGDGNGYSVFGAFNAPLNGPLSWQFDGGVTVTDIDGADNETAVGGTAHLVKTGDANKLGAFVGFSDTDGATIWNVGGEGQVFLEGVNLGAAIGYFSVELDDIDIDLDGWALQGSATVFPSDRLSLGAGVGYGSADAEGVDIDAWTIGARAEYQFTDTGLSAFGAFDHAEVDDFDVTIDSFSIGLIYTFGGTLKDRETTGPSLSGVGGVASIFRF